LTDEFQEGKYGKTIQKEIDTLKEGQTMYLLDEPQHSFRTGNIYEFILLLARWW
jgi:hypothetical protein